MAIDFSKVYEGGGQEEAAPNRKSSPKPKKAKATPSIYEAALSGAHLREAVEDVEDDSSQEAEPRPRNRGRDQDRD
ncbi:MAG: hypothetical protein JKY65_10305, partial [Planctomycetes bacterium]|nr:hypothetical protein [Planctomycetota bacterium]